MPIGVVGEGGRVMRVLVEPGDWVRAGQALATIERSVQTQQTRSLAAQVEVARADARLAEAELDRAQALVGRSEEHTSELQSLMRISYAVFCLKKKKQFNQNKNSALILQQISKLE